MELLPLYALLALLVSAPILAIVALVRSRKVVDLERQVARLSAQVQELRRATAEPGVPPTPSESPAEPRVAAPDAAPSSEAPTGGAEIAEIPSAPPAPAPAALDAPPPTRAPRYEPARRAPKPAPEPAPKERAKIEWERWIGVRGASLVGGVVAALAGLLFIQHSIQEGWITESMRLGLAIGAGLACVTVGEVLRRRRYQIAPDALSGAGVAILYGAFWAAHARYDLWPRSGAFAAMAATTVGCVLLAWRHDSRIVAVLGLVGGFATPHLLPQQDAGALELFGYVLLLDLGLLAVGRARSWAFLGQAAVFGTAIHEASWLANGPGAAPSWVDLAALAGFGLLFVAAPLGLDAPRRRAWDSTRWTGLIAACVLAAPLAARTESAFAQRELFGFAAALVLGVELLTRREERAGLGHLAALLAAAPLFAWTLGREPTPESALEFAVATGLLLALRTPLAALAPAPRQRESFLGVALLAVALAAIGVVDVERVDAPLGPGLLALLGPVTAALVFVAARLRMGALHYVLAALLAAAVLVHLGRELDDHTAVFATLGAALALAFVPALLHRSGELAASARLALWAAATVTLLTVCLRVYPWRPDGPVAIGAVLLLSSVGGAAAAWRGSGRAFLASAAAGWCASAIWLFQGVGPLETDRLLALVAAQFAVTAAVPALAARRFPDLPFAALAGGAAPLAFLVLVSTLTDGELVPGYAFALAAAGAACAWLMTRRVDVASAGPEPFGAYAGGAAVAGCFAVASLVGTTPVGVGLLLAPLGLALLRRLVPDPRLDVAAWVCASLGATLQVVRGLFPDAWQARESLLLTAIDWGYLLPTAALFGAALVTRRQGDDPRARGAAAAYGLLGVALGFLWLNLVVANAFATGPYVELWVVGPSARDVSVSVSWAAYALALLVAGLVSSSVSIRWVSLATLVATLAKVFLIDLSELEGLHRVGSLLGLAISLLLVSLSYQRFVFGRTRAQPAA